MPFLEDPASLSRLSTNQTHAFTTTTVPDFGLISKGKHSFYIITARDPFDRAVSAFVFEHLDNWVARGEKLSETGKIAKEEAYGNCLDTLETFVDYIGDNVNDYYYPYHRSIVNTQNCTSFARAIMNARVRRFNHFFFNYAKIRSFLPKDDPLIFVTRQEHLWYDWKKINYLLGQIDDAGLQEDMNARNLTDLHQPITRDLSDMGRRRFCKALEREYQEYVQLLRDAINLSDDDLKESLEQARRTCPNINLLL